METIQERFEAVKEGAVKQLTRKTFVDPNGELDLFWDEDLRMRHNHFTEIGPAISQCIDILKSLGGSVEKICGKTLFIQGETQKMQGLIKELENISAESLNGSSLDEEHQRDILRKLKEISSELERARAPVKQDARLLIDKVSQGKLLPEATDLIEQAELRLIERYVDATDKIQGTAIRLRKLLEERYRSLKVIATVRQRLGLFLVEFSQGVPPRYVLKRMVKEICGGKMNLLTTLQSIVVNPYFKRMQTYQIKRLRRADKHLQKYFETGNSRTFYLTLLGAHTKLSAPYREWQAQKIKKPVLNYYVVKGFP